MAQSLTASLFFYWIPEGAYPNPSGILQEVGIRADGSVWIIPNHLIPYRLMHEMQAAGCTVHVVKFDVSEAGKLVDMAEKAIRAELRASINRAEVAAARAAADFDCTDLEDGLVRYERQVRAIVKRTQQLTERLERSAAAFGMNGDRVDLYHAHCGIASIQTAAHNKASIFCRYVDIAKSAGYEGEAMADATESGDCHIGILADWLDDHDIDTESLRLAFREEIYGR